MIIFPLVVLGSASCRYNDPGVPSPQVRDSFKPRTHTIAQLKKMYRSGGNTIGGDVVINAQVISDDSDGNIYRAMYLQDETGGVEFKCGIVGSSLFFKKGTVVSLDCNALQLGMYGGIVNLGFAPSDTKYETGYLTDRMALDRMAVGQVNKELQIKETTISSLSMEDAHRLVRISGVQFLSSQLNQTYAAPENKENMPAVERVLEDKDGNTIVLRNSSYSRFAGKRLPEGSGSITAILSFFNGKPQLLISSDRDLHFDEFRFPSKK